MLALFTLIQPTPVSFLMFYDVLGPRETWRQIFYHAEISLIRVYDKLMVVGPKQDFSASRKAVKLFKKSKLIYIKKNLRDERNLVPVASTV